MVCKALEGIVIFLFIDIYAIKSYAPVIRNPGYPTAWRVLGMEGLKYHDFTFAASQ